MSLDAQGSAARPAATARAGNGARRPNLLFLITDQQRADTIKQGGPCLTPNLQRLARQGAEVRRCYAPNPICSPTRASLFTGLLPHTHGITDVTHAVPQTQADLAPDLPFWTRSLQEAGYRTGYFGKWHVERSDELERFGFDEYEVDLKLTGVTRHAGPLEPRIEVEQEGYQTFLLAGVADSDPAAAPEARLVDRGLEFLRSVTAGARSPASDGDDRPWALFVSSEAPHDPYLVPRSLYERYDPADLALPASFHDDLADKPAIYRRIAATWDQLSEEQVRQATACYYAACSGLDDQFGRLLEALEHSGQADDTIVVFTSDHGDYLGAHGLFLKGVPAFEEAYHMPLLVRGPGIEPGTVIEEPVSLLDLGRTLVRLLLGEDFGGHGQDLSERLQGGPPPTLPQAFAEFHGQRLGYTQRILWRERYKYVFNGFDHDELYDLQEDPHELVNLARRPEAQEVLRELAAALWGVVKRTGDDTLADAEYGMFRFAPVGPGASGEQRPSKKGTP